MDFLKNNKKMIGLAGCVLTILGCFLPFASTFGISINYASGDGIFVIVAAIVSGILIFLNKSKAVLIPSIIATVILANTTIKMIKIDGVSLEIGFVLILIGLIAAIVYPFLNNSK